MAKRLIDPKVDAIAGSEKNESPDFYAENGFMVFTEAFHLKRGYCCQSGCRHCPNGFKNKKSK
ncbi:MAG: hypothetical protein IM631_09335 [Cytophagales bacterium]|nr:hypothetical protein [Cytophagales bacterium]MCA6371592.1 hypothetical protein [Cytophagales bacterium]MCA6375851.1 hypothetical protein [Cytophagales bacterium]MCA6384878.1 hypothetical protein [Cytophagales bacterium]